MSDDLNISKEANEVISKYKGYGLWGGLPLGLLLGVLISGPYFHTWPLSVTAWVLLGFTVGGGIIGYCADHIAFASTTTGFGSVQNIFSWGDGHGHGSVGLDSSDHGGGVGVGVGDCGDGGGH